MKRIVALLLSVVLLCSLVPAAGAAETALKTLKINPYGGEESAMETVSWFASGKTYFLFLPSDMAPDAAKVYFTAAGKVTLDGVPVVSGDSAAAFTEGEHTLTCGKKSYPLTVCVSAHLPTMFLTTESGSLEYIHKSKENKEPGEIRVYENGELTLESSLKQIKGRGNSTWVLPKKPYNIKFDKKTSLLGMPKAKKWSLLASFYDSSLLRTASGFYLANAFGLLYTSEYRFVDLYINGEYQGNYFVCESVEVGENRVEVNDLEKANEEANPGVDIEALPIVGTGANGAAEPASVYGSRKWVNLPKSPAEITGGYLLELEFPDRYAQEPCGFVTKTGQPVVIKSPEYAGKAEVDYIADFVGLAFQALASSDGRNKKDKHFSAYFDMDSLVNMYLLQELTMNCDAGLSSFYLVKKEKENRLVFSPVWDLDLAFAANVERYGVNLTDPTLWWANVIGYNGTPTVLSHAYRHASFRKAVADRWARLRKSDVFSSFEKSMGALRDTLRASAGMNALRWNHVSTSSFQQAADKCAERATRCLTFINDRAAALDRGFGKNRAYLSYDLNGAGAQNWGAITKIAEKGDSCQVKSTGFVEGLAAPIDTHFDGWNTKADGTGTTYQPGTTITLTEEYTVLYAQWKEDDKVEPYSRGDVDGDGKITSGDARLALRASVNLESYRRATPAFNAADVNKNGKIESDDARTILRVSVKLEIFSSGRTRR